VISRIVIINGKNSELLQQGLQERFEEVMEKGNVMDLLEVKEAVVSIIMNSR
jgi:hypothetical protein